MRLNFRKGRPTGDNGDDKKGHHLLRTMTIKGRNVLRKKNRVTSSVNAPGDIYHSDSAGCKHANPVH